MLEACQLDAHGDVADLLLPGILHRLGEAFYVVNSTLSSAAEVWQFADEGFHAGLISDGLEILHRDLDTVLLDQVNVLRIVQLSPDMLSQQMR